MSNKRIEGQAEFLIALFDKAPIKHVYGMELSYENGIARFDLPYNRNFDHALDGIHGGAIATLLDNAGWFTAALHYETWIATVEFNVRLIAHAKEEALYSIGEVVHIGKRLAVCNMEVRTSEGDRLIATGSGTFVPTSVAIDE